MSVAAEPAQIIEVTLPAPFHGGWNRIGGVSVDGARVTIVPGEYFFRYGNPTWVVCDWAGVEADLLGVRETPDTTVEQMALDHVKEYGRRTTDPAEVLVTAHAVYSYLFRTEHLQDPALTRMGVTPRDLRVLTEMGVMMALNRVESSGEISNVGPAWMFAEAAKVVFGLDIREAETIDDLYHGTWFNEPRRVEQVKAHAALGGRLVHGCQSGTEVNMAGGCVVPFGADIGRFRDELGTFRQEWIDQVRASGE